MAVEDREKYSQDREKYLIILVGLVGKKGRRGQGKVLADREKYLIILVGLVGKKGRRGQGKVLVGQGKVLDNSGRTCRQKWP